MNQAQPPRASFASMLPGLMIMAFGGLIIWKEQLLKYLVGGFLILVGLGVIVAARKISRTRARLHNIKSQFQSGFGPPPEA